MLLVTSASSIYLHKLWSSDAQKFASTVAMNPRTQRKFVWSIAQMQRFHIPAQSMLFKGKSLSTTYYTHRYVPCQNDMKLMSQCNLIPISFLVIEDLSFEVETF